MGDPGSAKRSIEIIYNMIYETSSPKVRKAFRRSIAQCYAETMWDDMVKSCCKFESEFNLDECLKRAAAMVPVGFLGGISVQYSTIACK